MLYSTHHGNVISRKQEEDSTDSFDYTQELPLPNNDSHWESPAFNVNTGINTLVNSGAVLFSLISRLWKTEPPSDIPHFNSSLIREVRAFKNKASLCNYQATVIALASYCICATIDEAIQKGTWDTKQNIVSLVSHFYKEEEKNYDIFKIISQLSEAFEKNQPLLTFIYFCLALGYEGNYRYMEDGKEQLIQKRHQLYLLIVPSYLLKKTTEGNEIVSSTMIPSKGTTWSLSKWLLFFTILFTGTYMLCWWIEHKDNQLLIDTIEHLSWPSPLHDKE